MIPRNTWNFMMEKKSVPESSIMHTTSTNYSLGGIKV